jgi:hypothetical protein
LRLTRRGRVVLAGLTALLVSGLGIGVGATQAAGSAPARATEVRVTVGTGENLWWVAEKVDPDADPRAIIAEVVGLNRLTGTTIYPGEQLWVPRG